MMSRSLWPGFDPPTTQPRCTAGIDRSQQCTLFVLCSQYVLLADTLAADVKKQRLVSVVSGNDFTRAGCTETLRKKTQGALTSGGTKTCSGWQSLSPRLKQPDPEMRAGFENLVRAYLRLAEQALRNETGVAQAGRSTVEAVGLAATGGTVAQAWRGGTRN